MAGAIELRGFDKATRQLIVFRERLGPEMAQALHEGAELVKAHMKQQYLSGSPLRVRSGKLRGNWQTRRLTDTKTEQAVIVGTNTPYARVHNYGFAGPVFVRQHQRRPRGAQARPARPARSARRRLLVRAEARRGAQERGRLESQARASHGTSLRQVRLAARDARRSRGLQGPIEGEPGNRGVVRAHGRYMRIRGHLYVERSLRDTREQVMALLAKRGAKLLAGGQV